MQKLSNLPVESFLPLLLMKHFGSFAKDFEITQNFIEYGFDTEMIFDNYRAKTPGGSARKRGMLKEIVTEFSEQETEISTGTAMKAVQLIIDENAVNALLLEFVMIDRSMSIRDYLNIDPRTRAIADQMTTTNLGIGLPEIIEEFGEKKMLDLMLSLSHNLIKD